MFVSPNLYVEALISNLMVFGGGPFGGHLGHEGGTSCMGLKRDERVSLSFYHMWIQQEDSHLQNIKRAFTIALCCTAVANF